MRFELFSFSLKLYWWAKSTWKQVRYKRDIMECTAIHPRIRIDFIVTWSQFSTEKYFSGSLVFPYSHYYHFRFHIVTWVNLKWRNCLILHFLSHFCRDHIMILAYLNFRQLSNSRVSNFERPFFLPWIILAINSMSDLYNVLHGIYIYDVIY